MNGIRCGANLIFFQINSPFHQCFLLNRPSFLHWFATPPLLIPGVPGIWDCFWTLHSEIEYWSFPELIPNYSDCYNFIKYFYILKVILPLLFFYKKNVDFFMHTFVFLQLICSVCRGTCPWSSILCILFHLNFKVSLSSSMKNSDLILIKNILLTVWFGEEFICYVKLYI